MANANNGLWLTLSNTAGPLDRQFAPSGPDGTYKGTIHYILDQWADTLADGDTITVEEGSL